MKRLLQKHFVFEPKNLHLIFVELFGFGFLFVSLQEIVVVIIVVAVVVIVVVVVVIVDQLFREDSDANFKLQSLPLRIITAQGIGGSWKFAAEKTKGSLCGFPCEKINHFLSLQSFIQQLV